MAIDINHHAQQLIPASGIPPWPEQPNNKKTLHTHRAPHTTSLTVCSSALLTATLSTLLTQAHQPLTVHDTLTFAHPDSDAPETPSLPPLSPLTLQVTLASALHTHSTALLKTTSLHTLPPAIHLSICPRYQTACQTPALPACPWPQWHSEYDVLHAATPYADP